jgi:hypothetical protein
MLKSEPERPLHLFEPHSAAVVIDLAQSEQFVLQEKLLSRSLDRERRSRAEEKSFRAATRSSGSV